MSTHTAEFQPLSHAEFALIGLQQVAYIKPVQQEGQAGFGVFSADGRNVAIAATVELAQALIRQNEMEPMLVH